jgi:hypothetical protein
VHFNAGHHGKVPSRNTILLWIINFRLTGSTLMKKPHGGAQTVRTPENVETVRRAVVNLDLHYHPYKMMAVQELHSVIW